MVSRASMQTLASEDGAFEVSQFLLLLLAGTITSVAAVIASQNRTVIFVLAAGIFCAASREADDWFARWIFDDAYKWFVCVPLLTAVAYRTWKSRESIQYELMSFFSRPHASLIAFAILIIATLCNTLDRSSFWPTITNDPSMGDQKAIVEETAELFGYLVLLFGVTELLIHSCQEKSTEKRRSITVALLNNANESPQSAQEQESMAEHVFTHPEHVPHATKPKQKSNDPVTAPVYGSVQSDLALKSSTSIPSNSHTT